MFILYNAKLLTTLMVQFKGNKIGIISYMDGFTMGMPQSKGKSHD